MSEFVSWWTGQHGSTLPLGHHLRVAAGDRWLRVHSLPESKRYPDTKAEWAELLRRGNAVATELLGEGQAAWLLVPKYAPAEQLELDCLADPLPALAEFEIPDDEEPTTLYLFGHQVTWSSGAWDPLLRAVANDELRVLFVSPASGEVVAPYDGGVDLILASAERRNALRGTFADWRSRHSQGL